MEEPSTELYHDIIRKLYTLMNTTEDSDISAKAARALLELL